MSSSRLHHSDGSTYSGAIQFHDNNCRVGAEPGTQDSWLHAMSPHWVSLVLCGIMDCIGYITWLIHEGHDSTTDMGTFFVYKLSRRRLQFSIVDTSDRFCSYTGVYMVLTPTEQASGIFYKLTGHITNLCRNIPVERVLNTKDSLDRIHAGFLMALNIVHILQYKPSRSR